MPVHGYLSTFFAIALSGTEFKHSHRWSPRHNEILAYLFKQHAEPTNTNDPLLSVRKHITDVLFDALPGTIPSGDPHLSDYEHLHYCRAVESWVYPQLKSLAADMPNLKGAVEYTGPVFSRLIAAAFSKLDPQHVVEYMKRPIAETYAAEVPLNPEKEGGPNIGQVILKSRTFKTHAEAMEEVRRDCTTKAKYNVGARYVGWSITPKNVLTNDSVYVETGVAYHLVTWIYTDLNRDAIYEPYSETHALQDETARSVVQYNYLTNTDFIPNKVRGADGVLNLLLHRWWALYAEKDHNLDPKLPKPESGYFCTLGKSEFHGLGDPLNVPLLTSLNAALVHKTIYKG